MKSPLVLVVGDDSMVKKMLVRFLKNAGIEYEIASNIEKAIDLYHSKMGLITHIALGGNLGSHLEILDSLPLARLIAVDLKKGVFGGFVFPMSAIGKNNQLIRDIIGCDDYCQILMGEVHPAKIKIATIKKIIAMIKAERGKSHPPI